MGAIANRLGKINQTATPESHYNPIAAKWQESAIERLDYKGSVAHQIIGELVAKLHMNAITVEMAERQFNNALWAGR